MRRYLLPGGMRYSTLAERNEFYSKQFNPTSVRGWFRSLTNKPRFAVVIGRHTRVFPKKYRADSSTTILINHYRDFEDLRLQILEFLPESVYYDQDIYQDGMVLGREIAFDLDPENLSCPIHGSLGDKMKARQGLSFCELELMMIKEAAIRLVDELRETFSKVRVVYSGRGYHIHVVDKDSFVWSYEDRKKFALHLVRRGFPIDEWVTAGRLKMIRLPFSLHGMVSRIVVLVQLGELDSFDPIRDERCRPRFLGSTSSFS
jgi:DNA primase catalytic subunit